MFGDIFILGFAGLSLIVTLTAPEQVIYVSEDEMSDIEKDALALELYLKDKEDHKKLASIVFEVDKMTTNIISIKRNYYTFFFIKENIII